MLSFWEDEINGHADGITAGNGFHMTIFLDIVGRSQLEDVVKDGQQHREDFNLEIFQ